MSSAMSDEYAKSVETYQVYLEARRMDPENEQLMEDAEKAYVNMWCAWTDQATSQEILDHIKDFVNGP